jgi:hypothetical protein
MAGFGASSKKGKASKKDSGNAKKLNTRNQWDRFISDDLKRLTVSVWQCAW